MISLTYLFAVGISTLACHCASHELPEKVYYDLALSEKLFQDFVVKYNKKYSAAESEHRYQVFQENLKKINSWNEEYESAVFGINHFADLTIEELRNSMTCVHNTTDVQPMNVTKLEYPEELDLRKHNLVTEVKDQGYCGSCYIFGAIGEIEGQYAKKTKKLVSLSEQYPLDCNHALNCYGGYPHWVINWLATTPGPLTTADSPYRAKNLKCTEDPNKGVAKIKPTKPSTVSTTQELRTLLASHGPLVTCMFVKDEMFYYKAGIYKPKNCFHVENHAVTLVGYGKEKSDRYWLIKNSWGKDWGENGYLRIIFNACLVGNYLSMTEFV